MQHYRRAARTTSGQRYHRAELVSGLGMDLHNFEEITEVMLRLATLFPPQRVPRNTPIADPRDLLDIARDMRFYTYDETPQGILGIVVDTATSAGDAMVTEGKLVRLMRELKRWWGFAHRRLRENPDSFEAARAREIYAARIAPNLVMLNRALGR